MLKKILPWVVFVLLFGLIIMGLALKYNINTYLSKMMRTQADSEITDSSLMLRQYAVDMILVFKN